MASSEFLYNTNANAALDITGDVTITLWMAHDSVPGNDSWNYLISGDSDSGSDRRLWGSISSDI